MADTRSLTIEPGWQKSQRVIRNVVDPATLSDRFQNIKDRAAANAEGQAQLSAAAIQRRLQAQAEKAASEEATRQKLLQKTQQKVQKKLNKRQLKYQQNLQSQLEAIGGSMTRSGDPQLIKKAYSGASVGTKQYQKAISWANRQVYRPSQDWTYLCQSFARQAVGASAFGTTALNAWRSTPRQHQHFTYPPPPGSIAYYSNASGTGAGHAVFVGDNGYVYSNDIKRTGKIDIVKWNVFQSKWGMKYLGWIDRTPSGPLPIQGSNTYNSGGGTSAGGNKSKSKPKKEKPTYSSGKPVLR